MEVGSSAMDPDGPFYPTLDIDGRHDNQLVIDGMCTEWFSPFLRKLHERDYVSCFLLTFSNHEYKIWKFVLRSEVPDIYIICLLIGFSRKRLNFFKIVKRQSPSLSLSLSFSFSVSLSLFPSLPLSVSRVAFKANPFFREGGGGRRRHERLCWKMIRNNRLTSSSTWM